MERKIHEGFITNIFTGTAAGQPSLSSLLLPIVIHMFCTLLLLVCLLPKVRGGYHSCNDCALTLEA